jgi:PAS domain S-box-containing protein
MSSAPTKVLMRTARWVTGIMTFVGGVALVVTMTVPEVQIWWERMGTQKGYEMGPAVAALILSNLVVLAVVIHFAALLSDSLLELKNTRNVMDKSVNDLDAQKLKLLKEKARDDALLGSIGEGIVVLNQEGCIEMINRKGEELVGWKQEEIMGKKWADVAQLHDAKGNIIPPEKRATRRVLETGEVIKSSSNYYSKRDGTSFPVDTTAAPVVMDGKVVGVIAVFRDISHEKEVDRAKSEFVSLASHQLRTPLSAIKWFTEMLVNGDAGQLNLEQVEFVSNISQSCGRMVELVNSLLNISRIESGRIIVDPVPTDLRQLVEEVIKEVKMKFEAKHQTLVVSAHDNLPKINLDPKLIRQVYMNLLTNANKYTQEGGEITIFISHKDDDVVTQVADNGYGIPEGEQDRLFQKFYRGSNIAKLETDGTGLGLYLVKSIIDSSGGKIRVDSKVGRGTTFWFTLPMSGMEAKKGEVSLTE